MTFWIVNFLLTSESKGLTYYMVLQILIYSSPVAKHFQCRQMWKADTASEFRWFVQFPQVWVSEHFNPSETDADHAHIYIFSKKLAACLRCRLPALFRLSKMMRWRKSQSWYQPQSQLSRVILKKISRRTRRRPKSPGIRIFVVIFWAWTCCSTTNFKKCQSKLRKMESSCSLKWSSWIGLRLEMSFWATIFTCDSWLWLWLTESKTNEGHDSQARSKSNIACICMSACLGALHQSNPSSEVSRDHWMTDTTSLRRPQNLRLVKAANIPASDVEKPEKIEKIKLKSKGITFQAFQTSKAFGGLLPSGMGALYYHYSGHRVMCIIDIFDAIAHYFQCHPDHPDKDKEVTELESLSLRDSQLHHPVKIQVAIDSNQVNTFIVLSLKFIK